MRLLLRCACYWFLLCHIYDTVESQAPQCRSGCVRGQCVAPDQCTCDTGFKGQRCDMQECPGGCGRGHCTGPDQCNCPRGYTGASCETPDCPGGCGSGWCTEPERCNCPQGYTGPSCGTSMDRMTSANSRNTELVSSDAKITIELKCGYTPDSATDVKQGRCFWTHPNGTDIQVQDIYDNVHPEYLRPDNFTGNQCGFVLKSVSAEDVGTWTCLIPLRGTHLTATMELTFQDYMGDDDPFKVNMLVIVLGLLVVILFLAWIFTCLCCRKAPQNKQTSDNFLDTTSGVKTQSIKPQDYPNLNHHSFTSDAKNKDINTQVYENLDHVSFNASQPHVYDSIDDDF